MTRAQYLVMEIIGNGNDRWKMGCPLHVQAPPVGTQVRGRNHNGYRFPMACDHVRVLLVHRTPTLSSTPLER